jgi:hypothetical protein
MHATDCPGVHVDCTTLAPHADIAMATTSTVSKQSDFIPHLHSQCTPVTIAAALAHDARQRASSVCFAIDDAVE